MAKENPEMKNMHYRPWTPTGFNKPMPAHWKVNTAIGLSGLIFLNYFLFRMESGDRVTYHRLPNRWVPSMLWHKQFTSGEYEADRSLFEHPAGHHKEEHH